MMKCRNWGHDSHCGNPMMREEKNDQGQPYQIEVWKNCRCNNWTTPDWG